jgi:hypothetical protein
VAGAAVKQTPIADQDIDGGCACRPFSHNDKQFEWGQKLTRDEVLAIPLEKRRAWVELGVLKIYKRRRQQRHVDGNAVPVTEKPPPWKKAPTERENNEMRAWIEKTLAALLDHNAQAADDFLHALVSGRLSSQQARHAQLYAKWLAGERMREARYGNLEPVRNAVRKRLSGAEGLWIKEPPRKRGQRRPQRERDERNVRLLSAIRYMDRIRGCFAGRWPRALVVEVVAAHYKFSVSEVERALHQGAKEVKKALWHLTD